jgi:Di- and tripeptidases
MQDIASLLNKKYGDSRISLVIEDEYANMKDFMSDRNGIVDLCLKAYESAGVEPKVVPIRGGTDGATLSEKGLFCPNIFIGGHLYHSIKEFVSLQAMEKAKDILINIIRLAGEKRG